VTGAGRSEASEFVDEAFTVERGSSVHAASAPATKAMTVTVESFRKVPNPPGFLP
jgi:hypothetical protein